MECRVQITGVSGHLDQPFHDRFRFLAVDEDMGVQRMGARNASRYLAIRVLHDSQCSDLHVVMLDVSEKLGHQTKGHTRKRVGKTARSMVVAATGGALKRKARSTRQIGPGG